MSSRLATLFLIIATGAGARAQVYQTDFSDSSGWTLETSFNVCWCVDASPASMPGGAFRSAPASLNFNDGVNYEGPSFTSEASATSGPIDLSSLSTATLSFWCNYETEEDCVLDQRNILVSNDGFSSLLVDECAYTNCAPIGVWHEHQIALDPDWGVVQIRFHFDTFDNAINDLSGWFIDDLEVREGCAEPWMGPCFVRPNSVSAPGASIGSSGSTSIAANDFRLETFDCPPNEAAVYFYGQHPAHFLFGDGTRCIAGPVYRLPVVFGGPSGTPTYLVDLTSAPEPNAQITAGSTWRFQCWYRDPAGPLGSSFNLSGALVAFFCP